MIHRGGWMAHGLLEWRSERGGGEPGVQPGFGGFGRLAEPGVWGVREVCGQVLVSPIFGRGEGGVAERVGQAPTHFDDVVEASLLATGSSWWVAMAAASWSGKCQSKAR